MLASAGGTEVKIWDIVGGGRLIQTLGNHQKTVTSLTITALHESSSAMEDVGPRLLTSSLDGHVRVFDMNTFKVTQNMKYPHPLLSMGFNAATRTLAVGTAAGLLYIRKRKQLKSKDEEVKEKSVLDTTRDKKPKQLRSNSYRYFLRGRSAQASEGDHVLTRQRKVKIGHRDKFLRKFMYKEAFNAALRSTDVKITIAMIEELIARRGLVIALSNRSASSLEDLLKFLCKWITNPKQAGLLIPLCHLVLDMYTDLIGKTPQLVNLVALLQLRMSEEVKAQCLMGTLQGIMEPLIQASAQI
jgi:U3 small nucleolar RNA-associated protein 15